MVTDTMLTPLMGVVPFTLVTLKACHDNNEHDLFKIVAKDKILEC